MNARQKAKKYKRELDILKGRAQIPFLVEKTLNNIETIRAERHFPMEELANIPPKVVVNSMIVAIMNTDDIRKAVKLDNHYVMGTDTMIIRADLKVVMPDA